MTRQLTDAALLLAILLMCCLGCAPAPMAPDSEWLGVSAVPGEMEPPAPEPVPAPPVAPGPTGLWIVGLPVAATQEACHMWAWSGLTCELAASPAAAWLTLTAEDEPDCTPGPDGQVWLGSAPWRAVSIHLSCWRGHVETDDNVRGHFVAAVAHEIGHALGLGHVTDPDALLYPRLIYQRALNDTDRAEFARVWGDARVP